MVARLAAVVVLLLIGALVAVPTALASVSISRAELSGTQLRLEGTALPSRTITVNGLAMGTSDGAGNFKIQRDPFSAPADCRVNVNDGSASPTTATLTGCTVSSPPPSASPSVSSVTVDPTDILMGNTATGTVRLTSAAPA